MYGYDGIVVGRMKQKTEKYKEIVRKLLNKQELTADGLIFLPLKAISMLKYLFESLYKVKVYNEDKTQTLKFNTILNNTGSFNIPNKLKTKYNQLIEKEVTIEAIESKVIIK